MIEITDEMVEAYMDAKSKGWRKQGADFKRYIKDCEAEDLKKAAKFLAPLIAAQAAAAEREECARIAERRTSEGVASVALALAGTDYMRGMTDTSEAIARAIRARGDKA